MLWEALSAARDLGRVHDIASVLIRYGFGDAVRRDDERWGRVIRENGIRAVRRQLSAPPFT